MSLYRSVFLLLTVIPNILFSQKIVDTKGIGETEFSTFIAETEAKRLAKDNAVIDAIENAFGTVVIDGSATYISNTVTKTKTESKSLYNFVSNKAVNGELLEVISEEYSTYNKLVFTEKDTLKVRFLKCAVLIKARELIAPPVQFDASPLKCENKNCRSLDFKDGEDFYFYFSSPVSGYLWIYLDDGKQAQCLLPYMKMPKEFEGGFPVLADNEYIFFSKSIENHHLKDLNFIIDTYQLSAESAQDLNRVFVVFSGNPLAKPKLEEGMNKQSLSDSELKAGYAVPKALPSEDFQKWLIRNRSYKNVQVSTNVYDITITKTN